VVSRGHASWNFSLTRNARAAFEESCCGKASTSSTRMKGKGGGTESEREV